MRAKRIFQCVCISFVMAAASVAMAIAAPVTIKATKYHVTILKEGKCEILYEITFTEHESRDRIRSIGQFIEPMKFIESYGTTDGRRFQVTMSPLGNGFYSALFNITTRARVVMLNNAE